MVGAYTVFASGFLLLGGRAADLLGPAPHVRHRPRALCPGRIPGGRFPRLGAVGDRGGAGAHGIGCALLFPATLSLINRLFAEGPERNRALAVWGGAGASGPTLGSLLGGFLTGAFGSAPRCSSSMSLLAGAALAAAFAVIPSRRRRPRARRGFDLLGAATITAGATLLVYALVEGPDWAGRRLRRGDGGGARGDPAPCSLP